MKEVLYFLFVGLALGAWQDGADIKAVLKQDELDKVFNFGGDPDEHLTLLSLTPESVFVGAKDTLYNFSLNNDLISYKSVNWTVSPEYQESCQFKGQSESKCHNFIRVFQGPLHHNSHPNSDGSVESRYLLCGTNAFKPTCRWYSADLRSHGREFSGVGYSPFDPTNPSTSVLHHDAVYAATIADFGGTDSLIYKQPLRTEQYYDLHLNNPSFVSSRSFGDLALFFFREAAVEHSNCGKAVFSRVARICRHDNGGRKHRDRFTTFLKARLNCSIPGEFPFYFDHIQGTSDIFMNNERREEMFYAVFTTPPNSIGASAVCSFYMKDILAVFDGPFKGQSSHDSNWLPVPQSEVPKPRPGECSNDPTLQPDSNSMAFIKGHPLMDEAVQGTPVLVLTSNTDKFSSLTVDHSPEVAPYHIIYVGTDSGKVLKAVVKADSSEFPNGPSSIPNVISQSWEVFPKQSVKSVHLVNHTRLVVLTENEMSVISVTNCDSFSSCIKCVSLRDPHCGWDKNEHKCVPKDTQSTSEDENFIQSLVKGDIQKCPFDDHNNEIIEANHLRSIPPQDTKVDEECCSCSSSTTSPIVKDTTPESVKEYFGGGGGRPQAIVIQEQNDSVIDNNIPRIGDNDRKAYESSPVRSGDGLVSSESVILATTSSAILSLLVGFSLGFLICKLILTRKNKSEPSTNAQLAASLNESQRLTKPIDFLVNVPTTINRNPMKNNLNTDTLEKTVKKIYL